MHSKTSWLVLLLGASLILNLVTFNRVGELGDQVDRIRRDLHNLSAESRGTRSEVGALSRTITKMEEEQRWLLSQRWQIDEAAMTDGCRGPLPVSFEWTFRELPPEAVVSVEVRPGGASQWQSLRAEQTGELAYQAQAALDPQQSWEYRVVAASPTGSRSTSPQPMQELALVTRKIVTLSEGEVYSTRGRQWVRYLLLPHWQVQSPCNGISAATLEVLLEGKVVEVREMVNSRPPQGPPDAAEQAGGSASSQSSDGTGYELGWWTDWIELPPGAAEVRARVTFTDGESAVVPSGGECCSPKK